MNIATDALRFLPGHLLPTIFAFAPHASAGALITYGIDRADALLRTTEYVDRILRGTKPADLPVQGPRTFKLVVNLKTAKALGLTISPTLLARRQRDLRRKGRRYPAPTLL